MNLNRKGFTLAELMVVIAILGVLMVTSVPVYHKWLQRARGSEVKIMLNSLVDGEISYFLDNDEYFPKGETLSVYHGGELPDGAADRISENLLIKIPKGHYIDYTISSLGDTCMIELSSSVDAPLDLFENTSEIYVVLDKNGLAEITYSKKPEE